MASKYLKNSEGIVRAITTDNLQLEKPLLNENYDIEVHNRNMDKIDNAIQEVKGKVDGLELTAQRVSIADSTNKFEATNVEDALKEVKTKVDNGQNHKLTQDDGRYIQTRDTGNIDNPVLGWFNYFNAKGTALSVNRYGYIPPVEYVANNIVESIFVTPKSLLYFTSVRRKILRQCFNY